jgi:hypothetical protein
MPWIWTLGMALLAGSIAWAIGESLYDHYDAKTGPITNRYDFTLQNQAKQAADRNNARLSYGVFGVFMGLIGGLAGGLYRRSAASAVSAGLVGLILGGIGAALVSFELAPMFPRFYRNDSPTLMLPILVRGGTWTVIGMAAGLAFGLGSKGLAGAWRPGVGGLLGGVAGTFVVEVLNAIVSPMDRNDQPIPASASARLVMYVGITIAVACGVVMLHAGQNSSRRTPNVSPPKSDPAAAGREEI